MTIDARIRADIEQRIRSGEWAPGHRIPFEHELVSDYGCARATVSKALAALARDGLVVRKRKAGSFVARPHHEAAVLAIPDIEAVVANRGGGYRFVLDRRSEARAKSGSVFAPGTPLLILAGVHHAADGPFAHETRSISLAAAPAARDADFADRAPGGWLLDHIAWNEARHRISAIAATVSLARALGIARGTACLAVDRSTAFGDAPITHVRQVFPGDRYDLVATFRHAAS